MLKKVLTAAFFLSVTLAAHADAVQKIASKVQKAVVFLNGAQVTRTATVNISAGNSVLTFTGISPDIDVQSLQVKGAGDFTILSVKHELDFLNQQTKQTRVNELQLQQQQINNQLELLNSSLAIYQEEHNMLMKNQVVSGNNNVSLDVLKLKQALDFQTQRLTEIKKKQLAINAQILLLNADYQKYASQIADITRGASKNTSNILVTVSAKNAVQSAFTLTYLTKNASWFPTYDIRAKNVNSPIRIVYKANVTQQCGEEWNNIKLTLSTGNPSVSGSKPELAPYFLNLGMLYVNQSASISKVSGRLTDQADNQPLPGVSIRVKGTTIGAVTDVNGNYTVQVPAGSQYLIYGYVGYENQELPVNSATINVALKPMNSQLNDVVVVGYSAALKGRMPSLITTGSVSRVEAKALSSTPLIVQQNENQTNVEFNIQNPYTIPSDGKQYLVEINEISVPAMYEYYTAPKLSTDVFLTAKLTNWNQYSFLPGEANLFFEDTFIGKSLLDARSTTDTLNLSLGTDKNIVVIRTLQKDLKEKQGLLGSNKKETRDWLITVKNRKSQPVNLLVEDQVPVSQHAAVEVDTQQTSGGKVDAETGRVSWNLTLNSLAEKKLQLKYQVRYPKNQAVVVQ